MTAYDMLIAIGDVDPAHIDTAPIAKATPPLYRPRWRMYAAVAACVVLVLGIGAVGYSIFSAPDPVYLPPHPFPSVSDPMVRYVSMVNYDGRVYRCDYVSQTDRFVGEQLEGAAVFPYTEGKTVHAVSGLDPSFAVCTVTNGGHGAGVYICDNDITLQYGEELYQDRLHLSEQYDSVQYILPKGGDFSGEKQLFNAVKHRETVEEFIQALENGTCIKRVDYSSHAVRCRLFFICQSGVQVELWLYEDGTVVYTGVSDIAVEIDKTSLDHMLTLLT